MHATERPQNIPWIVVALLVLVFFFSTHHFVWVITGVPDSAEIDATGQITEGNALRRVMFTFLGVSGIFLLLTSRREARLALFLPGWLFVLYVCWAFLSVTWSVNPPLTIRRLILFGMMLLYALGLSRYLSNQSFVKVVFLCTTIFLFTGMIVELRSLSFAHLTSGYRFAGTLHPNIQGVNCALLVLSGVITYRLSSRRRFAIALAIVIGFCILLLTRSRASFGALVFSLVLYALLSSSMPRKLVYTLLFIIAIGLIGLSSNAPDVLLNDVILMGRHDESTRSLVGRIPLWQDCLTYASRRPVLGYGFSTFWTEDVVLEFEALHGWAPKSAHSVYIEVLLSLGIVGAFLFFSSILFGTHLSYLRGKNPFYVEDIFLFYVLVFGLFHGFLESNVLYANFPDFSTFVALCVMVRMGLDFESPRVSESPLNSKEEGMPC